ncbi:hypothetical protein BaRGS_00015100 [Batillaria attramentaria]|uniref:Uncharacterized protein n=1 Tax=Batillaria attramentaria TaxID=370345 RepID=A0ABD0L2P5_9CAEN
MDLTKQPISELRLMCAGTTRNDLNLLSSQSASWTEMFGSHVSSSMTSLKREYSSSSHFTPPSAETEKFQQSIGHASSCLRFLQIAADSRTSMRA